MKRSIITSARVLTEGLQERGERFRCAMVTLTYRDVDGYAPRHITEFLKRVGAHLGRRGHTLRYDWKLELQKRGAPHYHVLLWLPRGLTLPKPDKRGWWTHGSSRIEWARNGVGYIAKYASKGVPADMKLPKGARLHGHGGLNAEELKELRWWMLPRWVRETWGPEHEAVRARGGGFVSQLTGEIIRAPGRVVYIARGSAQQNGARGLRGWTEFWRASHVITLAGASGIVAPANGVRGSEVADSAKLPPVCADHQSIELRRSARKHRTNGAAAPLRADA